ncbi:hypothetical protein Tco_1475894 [Tanacetum coccineum]
MDNIADPFTKGLSKELVRESSKGIREKSLDSFEEPEAKRYAGAGGREKKRLRRKKLGFPMLLHAQRDGESCVSVYCRLRKQRLSSRTSRKRVKHVPQLFSAKRVKHVPRRVFLDGDQCTWFPTERLLRSLGRLHTIPTSVRFLVGRVMTIMFTLLKKDVENIKLSEKIRKLRTTLAKNSRIDMLLNDNNFIENNPDKGTEFFHEKYDRANALIEKARSRLGVKKTIEKLRSSSYNPNIFLGWKSDDDHDDFEYELE